MAKVNSRSKGTRGELELSKELQRLFGLDCRRGQQFSGSNESPDVVGLPGVHIECKRVEQLNIYNAVTQAIKDSAGSDNVPAVFHRKNGKQWLVTVELDELVRLSGIVFQLIRHKEIAEEIEIKSGEG